MDHDELMRLWRADLQRTKYGSVRESRLPTPVYKPVDDFALPKDHHNRQGASGRIKGRIIMKLKEWGHLDKQIAYMMGLTIRQTYWFIWIARRAKENATAK